MECSKKEGKNIRRNMQTRNNKIHDIGKYS